MENVTTQHKVLQQEKDREEGFNSLSSSLNHLSINTQLEYKENSYYNIIPFNKKLVYSKGDIKNKMRTRGSRIPKSPMRKKYLKYLFLPKKFILSFRFATGVDYSDLYKAFSPRQLASFFCLFAALRIFENYITHKKLLTERGKFVTINSNFLRNVITTFSSDCTAAINLAIYLGYIERDNSYRVGHYSKGFRLGVKFKNAKWIGIDFLDCLEANIVGQNWRSDSCLPQTTLWNRFNMHRSAFLDTEDPVLKALIDKQYEFFKHLRVVDDGTLESAIIEAATKTVEKRKKEDSLLKQSQIPDDYCIESVAQCLRNACDIINNGDVYIMIHDRSHYNWTERNFHPLTNLCSALRKYLRYKGQKLYNIDIRTCQVALLATLYDLLDSPEKEERNKFIEFINEKDFYTEVSKNTNLDRPEAKNTTFKVMFAKNYSQKGVIYEEFKRLFPLLIDKIWSVKKNEGYKRIAQIMQRTESEIMIRGVLNELLVIENTPAFSIHDSILCLEEDINHVKDIISDFFFKKMKFFPVIKVD
jgi:hypothetical protein